MNLVILKIRFGNVDVYCLGFKDTGLVYFVKLLDMILNYHFFRKLNHLNLMILL
jgi:hypothetical protein